MAKMFVNTIFIRTMLYLLLVLYTDCSAATLTAHTAHGSFGFLFFGLSDVDATNVPLLLVNAERRKSVKRLCTLREERSVIAVTVLCCELQIHILLVQAAPFGQCRASKERQASTSREGRSVIVTVLCELTNWLGYVVLCNPHFVSTSKKAGRTYVWSSLEMGTKTSDGGCSAVLYDISLVEWSPVVATS